MATIVVDARIVGIEQEDLVICSDSMSIVPLKPIRSGEIIQALYCIRMLWSQCLLVNSQDALIEEFRFIIFTQELVEESQKAQALYSIRMLWPQRLLISSQGIPKEWLSFSVFALIIVAKCQGIE